MRPLGRGERDDLSMARKSYSEELASSGGGPVRDDTGGDGAWDRSGPGDRARHAASVADLVRDQAQDRDRRLNRPGFCGGWFTWCRWLPVVIVSGCSG